ncbi:MAG: MmgE/PrpD family protein [Acidimicrobiales bacterium]
MTAPGSTPAAVRFAEWATSLRADALPAAVRRAAACHALDAVGTALAAARLGAGEASVAVARSFPAPEGATVLGSTHKVATPFAALANGTLIHALDYDDTHAGALVHPSAVVLPVALAVGEERRLGGRDVLTAAVAGIELMTRLGAAVPHGFHRRGIHATSACGVFAAALVASMLLGLTEDEAVSALGIAGSQAAGSLEFLHTGSDTKTLHPGLAAMSGIVAARLAAAGAQGPASVFEGENGFFQAYTGQRVAASDLVQGLGSRWETPAVGIKAYPACQLSHASLDALARLVAEDGDPAGRAPLSDRVRHVCFRVPEDSVPIVCEPAGDKRRPRTPYEAKFSLPWCAGTLLVDGRIDLDSFAPDRLGRPDVAVVADVVSHVVTRPGVPAADASGEVEVRLDDGTVLRSSVAGARGTAANPLAADDVVEKFVANTGHHPGAAAVARLLLDLDQVDEIGAVVAAAGELAVAPVERAPARR